MVNRYYLGYRHVLEDSATLNLSRRMAYATEFLKGYVFMDNCDASKAHSRTKTLNSQGLDVIVNPLAFDSQGQVIISGTSALLFKPTSEKSLGDAFKALSDLIHQELHGVKS